MALPWLVNVINAPLIDRVADQETCAGRTEHNEERVFSWVCAQHRTSAAKRHLPGNLLGWANDYGAAVWTDMGDKQLEAVLCGTIESIICDVQRMRRKRS